MEREGHPPDAARGIEAELLQVGVARSFEPIHLGPPERQAKPREQLGLGRQLVLDLRREQLEFRVGSTPGRRVRSSRARSTRGPVAAAHPHDARPQVAHAS
jgi:hypothetical protein